MPRKNARPKHRRGSIETLLLDDVVMDWVVELTNGSGRTTVEVSGSKKSAWQWAVEAGARGGIKPGYWYPVDIHSANDVFYLHDDYFITI